MNHLDTKKVARKKKDITNRANIPTISVRREVLKRDHIITTIPDINMKMDMKSITDIKKSMARKVCIFTVDFEFFFLLNFIFSHFTFSIGGSDHSKKWGHKKGKGH